MTMFPDAGPTARALLALEIIQNKPGVTAGELATRLGVTERAARRSVTTLRDIGVPVESATGPHGGYRLGGSLRLPPLLFTPTEALALVMAVIDATGAGDGNSPVGAALGKLIAALPANVARQAEQMRTHAAAAPNRIAAPPDPVVTSTLVAAVAEQRRLALTYRTPSSDSWREEVDPWGVVARYGRWYLLCHSHRVDGVRTYRIDRISDIAATGATFALPDGLDVMASFEEHLGAGWEHPTRVVFDAPVDAVQPWIGPSMGRLEPHPDGAERCVLVGSTSNPAAYAAEWLAPIRVPFRVEGGAELIDAMRATASRLAGSVDG